MSLHFQLIQNTEMHLRKALNMREIFLLLLALLAVTEGASKDSVIFSCDFENEACGLVNQVGMRGKWNRVFLDAGGRKGMVMSVTPSDDSKQLARLVGPYFESHTRTSGCLSLDIFLSGEGATMLRIEEQTDDGFQMLLTVHNHLPHWRTIQLPVQVPESVRFVFEGQVNTGHGQAIIALDNVVFVLGYILIMHPSSSWMGYPSDDKYYKHSNFEIYFGPCSSVNAPLVKENQTTVLIKNLPCKVTKEMIQELLVSKPVEIPPSSIVSVDLLGVVGGKASCKIEVDSHLPASLVYPIHTWYMRIKGIQDQDHESNILVEYPVPPVHPECNDASIQKLKEQLKEDSSNDSTFKNALSTLEHWLIQGEVNKRNADGFSAMLYAVFNKVSALNNEKMASDSKLHDDKKDLRSKVEGLSLSLKDFKKVLENASRKKVWDHFTKPQRKNLDAWREEVDKLEEEYSQELLKEREEDEMEICDGERESAEIPDDNMIASLKEQLDTLQNRKATLQTELAEYTRKKEEELARSQAEFRETLREIPNLQEKIEELKKDIENSRSKETDNPIVGVSEPTTNSETALEPSLRLSGQDVYQLGFLTSFLNIHSNGANIEYLTSFLKDSGQTVAPEDVEDLMRRFPNIFVEETIGIGADLRKVWKYVWPVAQSA